MSIYGSWQEAYEDYIDRGFSPVQAEKMANSEEYGGNEEGGDVK